MKPLDLSIIVLNYNTKNITDKCIELIEKNTSGISFELVVVDNNSTDGSQTMIKEKEKKYKNIKTIFSNKNTGFTGGNNQGIKKASGRYLLLLNSDAFVRDNIAEKMVNFMDENKKVGISTCSIENNDGTNQETGGHFPNLLNVAAWMFFLDDIPVIRNLFKPVHPKSNDKIYKKDGAIDWITGAFFMIRSELINQVGVLDEDYFMYVEDIDYCYRAKKAGWTTYFTKLGAVTHLRGASGISKNTIIKEFENMKLFFKKHKSPLQTSVVVVILKIGALIRLIIFGLIGGKLESAYAYAKVFITI